MCGSVGWWVLAVVRGQRGTSGQAAAFDLGMQIGGGGGGEEVGGLMELLVLRHPSR